MNDDDCEVPFQEIRLDSLQGSLTLLLTFPSKVLVTREMWPMDPFDKAACIYRVLRLMSGTGDGYNVVGSHMCGWNMRWLQV